MRPGDALFVRPGLPHAIGGGVFLAEVQEPTDFSVHAEYRGFPIAEEAAHMGLGWDVMLDCFDRRAVSRAELDELAPRPIAIARGPDRRVDPGGSARPAEPWELPGSSTDGSGGRSPGPTRAASR